MSGELKGIAELTRHQLPAALNREGESLDQWIEYEVEQFLAGFKLSKRGNLWRTFDGKNLTIFYKYGAWNWCVASEGGALKFSPYGGYEEQQEAVRSLWAWVNGW